MKAYSRTFTHPEPIVPVPVVVVIVVVVVVKTTARPALTGAENMRAGALRGDMVPKIDAPSRRCQLFANETMACRCYTLGVYLGARTLTIAALRSFPPRQE